MSYGRGMLGLLKGLAFKYNTSMANWKKTPPVKPGFYQIRYNTTGVITDPWTVRLDKFGGFFNGECFLSPFEYPKLEFNHCQILGNKEHKLKLTPKVDERFIRELIATKGRLSPKSMAKREAYLDAKG